jgi:Cu2+-exporting ATPase
MCCADTAQAYVEAHASWSETNTRPTLKRDYSAFAARVDGSSRVELAVEGVRCASCMNAIENGVGALAGVTRARLNFSDRRLAVEWRGDDIDLGAILRGIEALGFKAYPFDPHRPDDTQARETKRLIRALAVAGFASMNVMLMAVSVWAATCRTLRPRRATSSTGFRP